MDSFDCRTVIFLQNYLIWFHNLMPIVVGLLILYLVWYMAKAQHRINRQECERINRGPHFRHTLTNTNPMDTQITQDEIKVNDDHHADFQNTDDIFNN